MALSPFAFKDRCLSEGGAKSTGLRHVRDSFSQAKKRNCLTSTEETSMKALIASIFALTLLGATAANAGIGVGAHVGGVGAGVHLSLSDGHRHHPRYCTSWRWRHHHRYCRRWSW
jgi:hypothetical protein